MEAEILLIVNKIDLSFLQMNYRSFEYVDERISFPLFLKVHYGSLCRLPEFQRYGSLPGVAEFRMYIAKIPLIIELLTLFPAGEVRKSLRNSGIPGVDGGNTTNVRAIYPFFCR